MRYIPKKTKVRSELLPHVTWIDLAVGAVAAGIIGLIVSTSFEFRFIVAISVLAFTVMLYVPLSDDMRFYQTLLLLFKFMSYRKKFFKEDKNGENTIKNSLIPYTEIEEGRYLKYGNEYYGMVIEIKPVAFFMLAEDKQNAYIRCFQNALGRISIEQNCQIVKLNKPIVFDEYIEDDENKFANLLHMEEEGELTHKEVEARSVVLQARVEKMVEANERNRVFGSHFYLTVFDKSKQALLETMDEVLTSLQQGQTPIRARLLRDKQLAVFLKANYEKDFDEHEADVLSSISLADWTMPEKVEFKTSHTKVNGKEFRSFNIIDYPLYVSNAWAYTLFSLPDTKIVVNLKPVPRFEAQKELDTAILEMQTKMMYSAKASKQIEQQTHLETLQTLLADIKNANESLVRTNIIVTCEEHMKKEVRALLREQGFRFTEMFGRQVDAFNASNISRLDPIKDSVRGINISSVAAMFPMISNAISDAGGFYLGYNQSGNVFVNFFRRDEERVNSNMMVIGKSGGGKSFATKDILANIAADNARVFCLDPEYEYATLANNLAGNVIDVGSGQQGRINPFHITPSLEDEEGSVKEDDYSAHLQFLEQYFRIILDGMSSDAFEKINSLVIEVYNKKGINAETDLTKLKPEDFPIFDDLYAAILAHIKVETDTYIRRMYQVMETYIQKFAKGGRNSNLWNGPTTLKTKENFVVFSFRSLLANRNMTLANAQMLLVLRYLNNEIIRNLEFNKLKGYKAEVDPDRRKIVIAVDEAHVFIDPKYPVALDFMKDLAKRIRKYDGMQIIITQNIKDFVGNAEIAAKSTAIINACQFTMVLSLAPNDMTDMVALYRNAGGINKEEQDTIVQASRGEAFFITSPQVRTFLKIEAFDTVRNVFSVKDYVDFTDEEEDEDYDEDDEDNGGEE